MIQGNNKYRANRSNPSRYGGNYRSQTEGYNQYGDKSSDQIRPKQFSGNYRPQRESYNQYGGNRRMQNAARYSDVTKREENKNMDFLETALEKMQKQLVTQMQREIQKKLEINFQKLQEENYNQ